MCRTSDVGILTRPHDTVRLDSNPDRPTGKHILTKFPVHNLRLKHHRFWKPENHATDVVQTLVRVVKCSVFVIHRCVKVDSGQSLVCIRPRRVYRHDRPRAP